MKANELRIGNKVSYEGSNVTVSTIADDEVTFSDYVSFDYPQIKDISGIELTEEWLVKFGFNEDIIFAGSMISKKLHYSPRYNKKEIIISVQFDEFENTNKFILLYYHTKIEYVHQLQNLYFALTGEELELKQA